MSDKIRISVSDLQAQAAELSAIASDFENQYRTAVNAMQNLKSAMSVAMALNMEMKSRRMILYYSSLNVTLQQGVSIANTSAESFENTDITLRKMYSDWLPENVKRNNSVSTQRVCSPLDDKIETMKVTEGFTDGSYNPNNFMGGVDTWNGQPVYGSQCFAMAHMMQIEVTGKRGYSIGNNPNDIQVGDVIHYYGDGADATYGHWVFVTAVNGNNLTVSEGNWVSGTVTHNRVMNINNISLSQIDRVG